jgi:ATP-dependent DNA helicase DinG
MSIDNKYNAHDEIDHIFKDLFPAHAMPERPEQIALSHRMLDAMLDSGIALCDAGTGIGKTYAYLVAGTAFSQFRAASGLEPLPILISTSSIALQTAARDEYLPFLSGLLLENKLISQPIQAVIRKGKGHYVCDERLEQRLGQLDLSRKNWRTGSTLLALREQIDLSEAPHLSRYDRERVCVPKTCDCQRETCRYLSFLKDCDSGQYLFQICNHNLLLADSIHRSSGRRPILPDASALIIDEAHKLPDAARQMFGVTLGSEDIHTLSRNLRAERFLLAAEMWRDTSAPLVRKLSRPAEEGQPFGSYAKLLTGPERKLKVIQRQLKDLLTHGTRSQMENLARSVTLFRRGHDGMVFYAMDDGQGGTMLCAAISDLTAQLRQTLWRPLRPVILASGTLAVGEDFHRFKEETGLLTDSRVTESVSLSPFDYERNCLLYLPQHPPYQKNAKYYDQLAGEIAALLKAAHGHALVLFTSYAAMSAVKEKLRGKTPYPVFTMGRNAIHTMEQFKDHPGSVLLATGAAWEGFDFPGDCVSLLIIPRLPFSVPDALKEKEMEKYPDLKSFLRNVVVPEMQIKLKQGFGRAIRTETDTCVIAILDERAAKGQRYRKDVLAALPEMPVTGSLREVERFIRRVKTDHYFREVLT